MTLSLVYTHNGEFNSVYLLFKGRTLKATFTDSFFGALIKLLIKMIYNKVSFYYLIK